MMVQQSPCRPYNHGATTTNHYPEVLEGSLRGLQLKFELVWTSGARVTAVVNSGVMVLTPMMFRSATMPVQQMVHWYTHTSNQAATGSCLTTKQDLQTGERDCMSLVRDTALPWYNNKKKMISTILSSSRILVGYLRDGYPEWGPFFYFCRGRHNYFGATNKKSDF
jgi:hypothetical protein